MIRFDLFWTCYLHTAPVIMNVLSLCHLSCVLTSSSVHVQDRSSKRWSVTASYWFSVTIVSYSIPNKTVSLLLGPVSKFMISIACQSILLQKASTLIVHGSLLNQHQHERFVFAIPYPKTLQTVHHTFPLPFIGFATSLHMEHSAQ